MKIELFWKMIYLLRSQVFFEKIRSWQVKTFVKNKFATFRESFEVKSGNLKKNLLSHETFKVQEQFKKWTDAPKVGFKHLTIDKTSWHIRKIRLKRKYFQWNCNGNEDVTSSVVIVLLLMMSKGWNLIMKI